MLIVVYIGTVLVAEQKNCDVSSVDKKSAIEMNSKTVDCDGDSGGRRLSNEICHHEHISRGSHVI